MFRQGFDVTILVTGEKQEDIASDGVVLPAVSRDVVYSYQYFDTMAGFDWNSARWMQNYANAGRRIFFVSGYEPDYYKTGNMARLEAAQMYLPHVPMEFAAVSSWCRNWLKQDYGQEAALLPNGTADAGSAGVEKSKTVKKILILGDCGNEAEHLQEAFCIVDGLDKRFYEICFYHYGEHLPASCPYQNACVSRTQKELQKIYKDCDIMLETSRQISGRTAPLAVMAAGGAVVAARDRANPDYLDEGRNCVMYEPGDVEGARRCIQKLSEDTAYVKQLIENGRHTAEQYSWKQIDPKITAFYQVNTSGAAAEAAVTME